MDPRTSLVRTLLVAVLLVSTALFVIGLKVERIKEAHHVESAATTHVESPTPAPSGAPSHSPPAEGSAARETAERSGAPTSSSPPASPHAVAANQSSSAGQPVEHSQTAEARGSHTETGHTERVLGFNAEASLAVDAAIALSLAMVGVAFLTRRRALLLSIAVAALAFAVLDGGEIVRQVEISRLSVAILAGATAIGHLSASALALRLGARRRLAA